MRFVQPDTIVPKLSDPQAWNRYSYVQNSPIRFNDPSGHMMDEGDGGCTNERDCSKNPSKKDLIASVIETGNKVDRDRRSYYRQLAVEMAIDAYDLDLFLQDTNMTAYSEILDFKKRKGNNLGYDRWFEDAGETQYWSDGSGTNIRIGEPAFRSPGYLASVIGHENVHSEQYNTGEYSTTQPGHAIMQVEAFHWQLDHRDRFDLTDDEVHDIQIQLQKQLEIWLENAPKRTGH